MAKQQNTAAAKAAHRPHDQDGAISGRLLRRGLKISHLRLLASLAQTEQMSLAADALGISQPAASRLAAEAEQITGTKLYERTSRGIMLTPHGQAFTNRARRMIDEISHAERELAELAEGHGGVVSIGAVTGPAVEHILPAVRKARLSFPRISVNMEVATSDVLAEKLLHGGLDFALCRRPPSHTPSLYTERVAAPEPVCLIVRTGHPLLRQRGLTLQHTVDYDWVLPFEGTLLRTAVERHLLAQGLPLPRKVFNTSSVLLTLATVNQTNSVAPMATAVATFFCTSPETDGPIQILPMPDRVEVEAYALLMPAGRRLAPAAQILYDLVVQQLDHPG